jgi:hypothetical protein
MLEYREEGQVKNLGYQGRKYGIYHIHRWNCINARSSEQECQRSMNVYGDLQANERNL